MSPTGERSSNRRNIRIRENPLGPQQRQTRIGRAKIRRVKTGGPHTLQRRNRQRKPQRRNHQRTELPGSAKELSEHIFKNLSDLASLKNNFTEQLTDDEVEDSAPFSLESTKDANKQPLTPPIYHLPSPQDGFVPLPQTQRNQSQRGNEENAFLLRDLFSTMRSFKGNDNYSVKAFFRDVEDPHIS
ncbi:hypothetical protein TNCV_1716451 [Trichonephila clavipes]|nr:hypothetical protein TNCV_1716451 [Trichonephila clavipes]